MLTGAENDRSSPPPAYNEGTPGGMENELYIDGVLHVDGVAVDRREQQRRALRQHQRRENPCENFLRLIRKLWATQQTELIDRSEQMDKYVRTTIRELIVYLVFIVILSIVVFGMVSTNMYVLTQQLNNVFLGPTLLDESNNQSGPSFADLDRLEDFWPYMTDIAVGGLYSEKWYNKENVTDYGNVLYENHILGAVQLRQKKVRNNSCVVASDFVQEIKFCYNSYAPAFEDKNSFGLCENLNADNCTNSAFMYTNKSSLFGVSVTGRVSSYDQGGFIQILGSSQEQAAADIEELKDNLWITRGTRAIMMDFTVYNANLNLFCQVQLLFEFPAVGGLLTKATFRTVKLIRYVNAFDYFVLGCEILFLLFIIYYTIEEAIEINTVRMNYFKSLMNCLDVIIIGLSYTCIIFNIYRQVQVDSLLDQLLDQQSNKFTDFTFLCSCQWLFNIISSITVFLAWIKIFKYVSFNKTMTQLSETLTKCAMDISGFAIMFFIIFFAYAQLGYLTFGIQVAGFRAFQNSVYTLFLIILGSFDFDALQQAHRVLGPIFFLTYVFFIFFVLLNMFLAIINDTYMEVKAELRDKKSEFEISDYVKQGYAKMRDRLTLKRDRIADIRKALSLADLNRDKRLEFDEWRTEMKSRGYAEEEIETIFAKYDADGDRVLGEAEQRALSNDLLRQNDDILREIEELNMSKKNKMPVNDVSDEEDEGRVGSGKSVGRLQAHEVSLDEYNGLAKRLDTMEASVGFVLTKIDNVVNKLDALENPKSNASGTNKKKTSKKKTMDVDENTTRLDSARSFNDLGFDPGHSKA